MANIKDTEYITVKHDANGEVDVFVGGKPATTYHARPIYCLGEIISNFKFLQKLDLAIEEVHLGAFDEVEAQNGIVSGKFGRVPCYRLKLTGVPVSDDDWVCKTFYHSPAICASNWANTFLRDVRKNATFRAEVSEYAHNIKNKANERFEFVSKVVRTKGDLRITIITEKLKSNGK